MTPEQRARLESWVSGRQSFKDAHWSIQPKEAAAAALAHIDRLESMRTHCDHCGGDYLATGLETGCTCRIVAERDHLAAELNRRDGEVNDCAEWLKDARTERDTLAARVAVLRAVLSEVEWLPNDTSSHCPWCGKDKDMGHQDCRLDAVLKGANHE